MKNHFLFLTLFFSIIGIADEFKKAQTLAASVDKGLSSKDSGKSNQNKMIEVNVPLADGTSETQLILGTLWNNGIKPKACDPENCFFELGDASAKKLVAVLKELKESDESTVEVGKSVAGKIPVRFFMSGNDRFETLSACKVKAEKVPDSRCYIMVPKDGSLSSRFVVKNGKTLATGMSQVDVSKFKTKRPECRTEFAILEPCVAKIESLPEVTSWKQAEELK